MGAHISQSFLAPSIITFFFIFVFVQESYCEVENMDHKECKRAFDCGLLRNLSYPFWSDNRSKVCGHEGFKLKCEEDHYPIITSAAQDFRVLQVYPNMNLITIARRDLYDDICPGALANIAFDKTLFNPVPGLQNLSLVYHCPSNPFRMMVRNFSCSMNGERVIVFYGSDVFLRIAASGVDIIKLCERVDVPLLLDSEAHGNLLRGGLAGIRNLLRRGFNVSYGHAQEISACSECALSGGVCGTGKLTTSHFICLCIDQPYSSRCLQSQGASNKLKLLVIGGVALGTGILAISMYCFRMKMSTIVSLVFHGETEKNSQEVETFIKDHEHLAPKRYSFKDVKKMTNWFKDKLGQGGYGSVYKGKLPDGRLVAVKVLKESRTNGEEFINEVASVSRTSHVNIVTLLGFCVEGSKRALIYEFMPNGSLERFICNDSTLKTNQHFGWENLHQVAIGIARGLEYLHRGCNTRIVHFDIKPHNILLDENFCPKISDFGLAKLCTKKESVLSLQEARGTIGYIAPELCHRNYGGASYKSDVYSYGMMVLEMVGGTKKEDDLEEADHSSNYYFPHWLYKRLELNEFGSQSGQGVKEIEIVRKMTIVGLWCIQTYPSDRPSMSKVIEMLEGNMEALKIPPRSSNFPPPKLSYLSYTATTSTTTSKIN